MRAHNIASSDITPASAVELLKKGNFRFINNLGTPKDLLEAVSATKNGQSPFAAILSCMDSRTSAELIFDQGLGDIFSIRIAGNVVSPNVLGSLEYATAVAGSKLIVVLGHTHCGAIKGACDHVKMGNLTTLLEKIEPAINKEHTIKTDRSGKNDEFVNAVAALHAIHTAHELIAESDVIRQLVKNGNVGIIPAIYDIATGKVDFMDEEAIIQSFKAIPGDLINA